MKTIDLTWLCFPLLCIMPILVLAYFRVQANRTFMTQYRAARARGAFDDLGSPETRRKLRWLSLTALLGIVLMIAGFALVVLTEYHVIAVPPVPMLISAFGSGLVGAVTGLLMQREIVRRL